MAFDRYISASIPEPAPIQATPPSAIDTEKNAAMDALYYQAKFNSEFAPKDFANKAEGIAVKGNGIALANQVGVPPARYGTGDFGYTLKHNPGVVSHYDPNTFLGSSVEFETLGNGQNVSVINTNMATANLNNQNLSPELRKASIDKQRKAVLMKAALDSGLGESLEPTPEESTDVARDWTTSTNRVKLLNIERAYALVNRNTSQDPQLDGSSYESDQFTRRFKKKYGLSPSEYLINGAPTKSDGTPLMGDNTDAEQEDTADAITSRQKEISELEKGFYNTKDNENPNDKEIKALGEEASRLNNLIQSGELGAADSAGSKQAKGQLAAIVANQQVLSAAQAEYWQKRKDTEQRLASGRASLEVLLRKMEDLKKWTNVKESMSVGSEVGKGMSRWGISDNDRIIHLGYRPAALDEIDSSIRYQYIVDKSIKRKNGESAQQFQERRRVKDRTDNPELASWLAGNNRAMFNTITESMPSPDAVKQSATKTLSFINNAEHLTRLDAINTELKNAGWAEGVRMKFSDKIQQAASIRAQLIGEMRVFIVGPGNPSNFEQEVLHSVVPEIQDIFSMSGRNQERLRALALISIMSHHNEKESLGYKLSNESLNMYNKVYSSMLGRPITRAEFDKFKSFSDSRANAYNEMARVGNIDRGDGQGNGYGSGKTRTKDVANKYIDEVTRQFGK